MALMEGPVVLSSPTDEKSGFLFKHKALLPSSVWTNADLLKYNRSFRLNSLSVAGAVCPVIESFRVGMLRAAGPER